MHTLVLMADAANAALDEVKYLTANWIAKGNRVNNARAYLAYLQRHGADINDVAAVTAKLLKSKDKKLVFEVVKFIFLRYDVAKGGNGKPAPDPPDPTGAPPPNPLDEIPMPELGDE